MHYYTSEQVSPLAWIFTLHGLFYLALIGLIIWFVWRYFKNRKNENVDDIPLVDKEWEEGHLPETSFWESTTEELKVEEKAEFIPLGNGLYEKDCTKQIVEDDILFDDVIATNIPEEEDVKIYKKEE